MIPDHVYELLEPMKEKLQALELQHGVKLQAFNTRRTVDLDDFAALFKGKSDRFSLSVWLGETKIGTTKFLFLETQDPWCPQELYTELTFMYLDWILNRLKAIERSKIMLRNELQRLRDCRQPTESTIDQLLIRLAYLFNGKVSFRFYSSKKANQIVEYSTDAIQRGIWMRLYKGGRTMVGSAKPTLINDPNDNSAVIDYMEDSLEAVFEQLYKLY